MWGVGRDSAVQPHSMGGVRGRGETHTHRNTQEGTCEYCTYDLASCTLKKCPNQPSPQQKRFSYSLWSANSTSLVPLRKHLRNSVVSCRKARALILRDHLQPGIIQELQFIHTILVSLPICWLNLIRSEGDTRTTTNV